MKFTTSFNLVALRPLNKTHRHCIILPIVMGFAALAQIHADTIVENTAGLSINTFFPGNSLTTSLGGAWDTITFNWFSDAPGNTPTAFGTLFLLSQEYSGTPQDLSSATPGFLAESQSTSGGLYTFDPSMTLAQNTRYFFYTDASGQLSGNNDVNGENLYYTFSADTPFSADFRDANYRLTGQVVPESTPTAIYLVLGLAALYCYTKRHA